MVDGVGKWCGVDYVVCYVYGGCVEVGWQCYVVVFGFVVYWYDCEVFVQCGVVVVVYEVCGGVDVGVCVVGDVFFDEIDEVCIVLQQVEQLQCGLWVCFVQFGCLCFYWCGGDWCGSWCGGWGWCDWGWCVIVYVQYFGCEFVIVEYGEECVDGQ